MRSRAVGERSSARQREATLLCEGAVSSPLVTAAGAEGGAEEEEPAEEVDVLLEELMDLFKQQNVSPSSTLVSASCLLLICTVWLLVRRCRRAAGAGSYG